MAYQFQNASILIVDGMEPMLTLVSSLLDVFGFKSVYQASDADTAFELFVKHNPDIVLVDWSIEPHNGIELVRRMRSDDKSPNRFVPIIMMTGYSHKLRVEEARDVGVTEFLVKPFKAKDLYTRIEQLIERPRQFVDSGSYFGPDRRRRAGDNEYKGPRRREQDDTPSAIAAAKLPAEPASPPGGEDAFLQELKRRARDRGASAKTDDKKDKDDR